MKAFVVALVVGVAPSASMVATRLPAYRGSAGCGLAASLAQPTHSFALVHAAAARAPAPVMQDVPFWENVVRFMRFGITSMTGLVAGLLSPFAAFLRTPTLTAIGAALLLSSLTFIYFTLTAMQSTPVYVPPPMPKEVQQQRLQEQLAPKVDPSMRKMLNDIYGEDDQYQ